MSSLNKAILIGNVGKDPNTRTMQNGDKVCSFSVATSEKWKDKRTGERQERTFWHNIVIFNQPIIEIAERFVRKGSKVYLEGAMENRKWTDDKGTDRWVTEVVIKPFRGTLVLLDGKDDRETEPQRRDAQSSAQTDVQDDPDQDIPF